MELSALNISSVSLTTPVCGVYRLDFDNGFFYIGGSINLRSRFLAWRRFLSKQNHVVRDMVKMRERIFGCKRALFSIIEVTEKRNVYDMEEKWLRHFKSNPLLLNTFSFNKKPVLVYDANGVFLEEWPSASWISKKKGIKIARVRDVLIGAKKSYKGLVYRYKFKEHENFRGRRVKKKPPKPIIIHRFTKNGEYVDGFNTTMAAAKASNVDKKGVYMVLRGKQKTAGGYIFKYIKPA